VKMTSQSLLARAEDRPPFRRPRVQGLPGSSVPFPNRDEKPA
jgi:hypothetical protein